MEAQTPWQPVLFTAQFCACFVSYAYILKKQVQTKFGVHWSIFTVVQVA